MDDPPISLNATIAIDRRLITGPLHLQQKWLNYLLEKETQLTKLLNTLHLHVQQCDYTIQQLTQYTRNNRITSTSTNTSTSVYKDKNRNDNNMSLFLDEEGNSMPSNSDAIQKFNLRNYYKYPTYRKKYDWKVHVWNPIKEQDVDEVVHSKLQKYLMCNDGISHDMKDVKSMRDFQLIFAVEESLIRRCNDGNKAEMLSEFWMKFWVDVAMQFDEKRIVTADECRLKFLQNAENKSMEVSWSIEEDHNLLQYIVPPNSTSSNDWWGIAYKHGNSRTPFSCLCRYQQALNKNIHLSNWTKEEDELLTNLVTSSGLTENRICKWNYVAARLRGRTISQCRSRWLNTKRENITQSCFTPNEDIKLQLLVIAYNGGSWPKIASHMPGRTELKCRERYENILHPNLKSDPWDEMENSLLLEAVAVHGYNNWAAVQRCLSGRTDSNCARQWRRLKPSKYMLTQTFLPIRKALTSKKTEPFASPSKKRAANTLIYLSFESVSQALNNMIELTQYLITKEENVGAMSTVSNPILLKKLKMLSKYFNLFWIFNINDESKQILISMRNKLLSLLLQRLEGVSVLDEIELSDEEVAMIPNQVTGTLPLSIMEVYETLFPFAMNMEKTAFKFSSIEQRATKRSKSIINTVIENAL